MKTSISRNYLSEPHSFAAYVRDENIRKNSSSGGIFYILAQYVLCENGIVYGAAIDNNGIVYHKKCTNPSQLIHLMKSKYVQSELKNCYQEIKADLLNERKVLFSGTPCQVQGLLSFLDCSGVTEKQQKNLLLIDLICHGVPSKNIWKKYLNEITKGSPASYISFRDKTDGWHTYGLTIKTSDGIYYHQSHKTDSFFQGFLSNLYLRPSCYECRFRGLNRASDFTLGDFWTVGQVLPDMANNKGTSCVIIHTENAMSIWNQIQSEIIAHEVKSTFIVQTNQSIIKSCYKHPNRNKFFKITIHKEIISNDIVLFSKFSLLQRIKRKLITILKNN